jgi:hypothetical protein
LNLCVISACFKIAMTTSSPQQLRHLIINNEYDVVAMRQDVREHARALGLGLIQQAKLATAISAVARAALGMYPQPTFTLQKTTHNKRPALEIACFTAMNVTAAQQVQMEQALHLAEARLLVDEAGLTLASDGALLTLRVWIGPPVPPA